MINWTPRLIAAAEFFRAAHGSIGHVRKYSGKPYFDEHCIEVAEIVSEVSDDEDVLIACAAHDAFEDIMPIRPEINPALMTKMFGERATGFAVDLTDVFTKEAYPQFNRVKRKKLECERIGTIAIQSKTIKLADLLSNTKSIVQYDPDFARTYLREKAAVLPYLVGGDPTLLARAEESLAESCKKLNLTIPKF